MCTVIVAKLAQDVADNAASYLRFTELSSGN